MEHQVLNSIMVYEDACADVTGVRFGSTNLSVDDIYGVQAQLSSQIIADGQAEAGAGVRLELWARNRYIGARFEEVAVA